jgi:hypothetical protein
LGRHRAIVVHQKLDVGRVELRLHETGHCSRAAGSFKARAHGIQVVQLVGGASLDLVDAAPNLVTPGGCNVAVAVPVVGLKVPAPPADS